MLNKPIQINLSAKLPVDIHKEGKWFISSCHILDVHSQGHTKKEAVKNLKEALSLFFVSCYDRGTLDNVLKECGFSSEFDKSQKTIIPKVSNIFFYSLNI